METRESLDELIELLRCNLPKQSLNRIVLNSIDEIDIYLLEKVILPSKFTFHGVSQLEFDFMDCLWQGVFRSMFPKPENLFKRLISTSF